ncbi:DUF4224 domain-containing protein [Xanthomonas sp. CFBP 7912]|uniref:DUF4224 domain-containing protein n=1 Tax=Xanthomonas sp. CFBP 7912 TaxID=1891621 RepID=UPI001F2C0F0A|nr:DUF4224 domain-containing protein [Xanthomonas sp. CFBP 7912]
MAELCLSRDEVAELCRTTHRAKQARFLQQNGVRHYLDAHGWPVVLRSAIDPSEKKAGTVAAWSPNKAA